MSDFLKFVVIFEEWKRRWDTNPEWFTSAEETRAEKPHTYGERAAIYFVNLQRELEDKGA